MSFRYGELLLITVNHESVSMEDRERYSLDEKQIQSLYQRLHQSPDIKESLILNTCNRFELYTKTRDPRTAERRRQTQTRAQSIEGEIGKRSERAPSPLGGGRRKGVETEPSFGGTDG